MQCSSMVVLSASWPVKVVRCGQCDACRAALRGQLISQIDLEVQWSREQGVDVTFLTWTYDPEHVPKVLERCDRMEVGLSGKKRLVPVRDLLRSGRLSVEELTAFERDYLKREPRWLPSLRASDQQQLLHRLRKSLDRDVDGCRRFFSNGGAAARGVRYFFCGEYGTESARPHFHSIFFGLPACRRFVPMSTSDLSCQCEVCQWYRGLWQRRGFVESQPVLSRVSDYVSGYVTKKMLQKHSEGLLGREPEFARWSTSPTLGAYMVDDAVREIDRLKVAKRMSDFGLKVGKSEAMLRRSLLERGRVGMGREKGTPDYVQWMKLLERFGDIFSDEYAPAEPSGDEKVDMKERVLRKFEGDRRRFRAKGVLREMRGVGRKDGV